MSVDVNELVALIIGGLLVSGLGTLLTLFIQLNRKTSALHETLLGPAAISQDTGLPRWFGNESRTEDLLKSLTAVIDRNSNIIDRNSSAIDRLLAEVRQEKEVEKRVAAILQRHVNPPNDRAG